jgi:hypothetical protein
MTSILLAVLTGGVAAALIKLIDGVIQFRLKRKAEKEDKKEEQQNIEIKNEERDKQQLTLTLNLLKDSMMIIMLDRLQFLCQSYIKKGTINVDERRRLHLIHAYYHKWGGNGDLDSLMKEVDELPLEVIKKG